MLRKHFFVPHLYQRKIIETIKKENRDISNPLSCTKTHRRRVNSYFRSKQFKQRRLRAGWACCWHSTQLHVLRHRSQRSPSRVFEKVQYLRSG